MTEYDKIENRKIIDVVWDEDAVQAKKLINERMREKVIIELLKRKQKIAKNLNKN